MLIHCIAYKSVFSDVVIDCDVITESVLLPLGLDSLRKEVFHLNMTFLVYSKVNKEMGSFIICKKKKKGINKWTKEIEVYKNNTVFVQNNKLFL